MAIIAARRAAVALSFALLAGCATPPARSGREPAPEVAAPAAGPSLPQAGRRVAPAPEAEPAVKTLAQATLGAVGDVLMHGAVKQSAQAHGKGAPDDGYAWLFAPIADLLAEPDVMLANLETPIAPSSAKEVKEFMFDAPPAVVSALKRAGVDLVHVANNHAFDQGRAGFEETLRRLEALGMPYVGAGAAGRASGPVRVEVNGLAIALLGYSYGFNQTGNACPPRSAAGCVQASELDRTRAVEEVRAAAASGVDAVVVSIHWGVEYELAPRAEDVELAHQLADAGAIAVIGHHPHVLQPVELYRRADGRTALVAYSLGNFISNQERKYVHGVTPDATGAPRDGALLRVTLARRDYGRGVVRVELAGADVLPLWTENDTADIDRKREPGRRPAIRVVANDRALAEVRAALGTFPDPVPPEAQDRWVALRRREALYLSRRAAAAAVLGEDLLRRLAPAELVATPAGSPLASPTAVAR